MDGIVTKPNAEYIESLLRLYDVGSRKTKRVPEHALLNQVDSSPELTPADQARFRSGLGMALYLAHDRVDVQFCVKSLASCMKVPTVQAEKQVGTRMVMKLNNVQEIDESEEHCMEVFCDSDWAGGPKRRSTTSVMVLIDGLFFCRIHEHRRALHCRLAKQKFWQ